MNDREKSAEKERQQRRLGAALRANLKRRKAQVKGRSARSPRADGDPEPHDSAGIPGDKRDS